LARSLAHADATLGAVVDSMPADTGTNTVGFAATLTLESGERVWSRRELSGGFGVADVANRLDQSSRGGRRLESPNKGK
jgi:hypothetical protein